ncbi:MAG TPA: beta-ketoacyl-ACP synthase II [Methylomirabilota bacterium]|nr:beta-ketoacyl-ACP synthase II [Methylomirabilota bacterium]
MTRRRVVVTGLGCITPAGNDVASTWQALLAGRSAVTYLPRLASEGCRCRIGAEVRGFDPARLGFRQPVDRLGRGSQFALAAAQEAHRDARLADPALNLAHCGTIVGTGIGDLAETVRQTQNYLEQGIQAIHPRCAPRVMPNAAAAHVALEFGFRGPSFATASGCAAAGHAIGLAARLIRSGDAEVMVAGGTEDISCALYVAAFDALHAVSTRNDEPEKASRPFDRRRDGFVVGEGAGMLVLEELDHARRRGASIYAELAGVGMTSEARHLTTPDPRGDAAAAAMAGALHDAGRRPADVHYVNAHGTSTPLNDRMETAAVRKALGRHASRVCVSATKSMIGHSIGASAAVGLIAAVLSIRDRVVHPTINYEDPDPACDLDYVPNRARELDVDVALVNAFAFGGHCVSLLVARLAGA